MFDPIKLVEPHYFYIVVSVQSQESWAVMLFCARGIDIASF